MSDNKAQSPPASRANRDPGFVKLRRGLRKHLPMMSSNAAKLYTWLLIAAEWKGERRGTYESTYTEIAYELLWNLKMLRRAFAELRENGYVEIAGAANQYENTLITILKYDQDVASFGGDTRVRSNGAGDSAADTAGDTSVRSTVPTKPSSPHSTKTLKAPKKSEEVKEIEEARLDAVRRRFDAERLPSTKSYSSKTKSQKLSSRLESKIKNAKDIYADFIKYELSKGRQHPFREEEKQAFAALKYQPDLNSPLLSFDFVMAVVHVHEEHGAKGFLPGNLCSKVIDYCVRLREESDGEGYYWPPNFQTHRDWLREEERRHVQSAPTPTGVRA